MASMIDRLLSKGLGLSVRSDTLDLDRGRNRPAKKQSPRHSKAKKTQNWTAVNRIDEHRIRAIEERLRDAYGFPRHHNPEDPLDDLIFVLLSRMTQEVKYVRTYQVVRETYQSWDQVREAPPGELEVLLGDAGLARTKSRHIQQILDEVERREGRLDLTRLRTLPDDQVEGYLTSLPGVGTKTARCVMLYALERDTLPVDAHVWRLARRLGFVPDRQWSDRAGQELGDRIPRGLRGSLHVTLLAHGRAICKPVRPRCPDCVLRDLCPSAVAPARRLPHG